MAKVASVARTRSSNVTAVASVLSESTAKTSAVYHPWTLRRQRPMSASALCVRITTATSAWYRYPAGSAHPQGSPAGRSWT